MGLRLQGIGCASPANFVEQEKAIEMVLDLMGRSAEEGWHIQEVYRSVGVRKRHSAMLELEGPHTLHQSFFPKLESIDGRNGQGGPGTAVRMEYYRKHGAALALAAARQALDSASMDAGEISHLVTVSCTGFAAPGIDCTLIEELGLPRTVARTNVGFMGCHGAFNGLRVSRGFAESEREAVVLTCAVELCSLHFDYAWDFDRVIANALFADGAAATVGIGYGNPAEQSWTLRANGTCLIPDSKDAMSWDIGDHGFQMRLSRKVSKYIVANLGEWLSSWLRAQGLGLQEVRTWAVHPGGPKILSAVEEALSLGSTELDVSKKVLANFGNMSSPTILFILDRLRSCDAPLPCVALGFGPGLTVEAMLFE